MPHIPKQTGPGRLASMSKAAPTADVRPAKPTILKMSDKPNQIRLGIPKLSVRKYTVDPDRLFKMMFDVEPEVDGHTGITTNFLPRTSRG